jgi:hypothetical protein
MITCLNSLKHPVTSRANYVGDAQQGAPVKAKPQPDASSPAVMTKYIEFLVIFL